MERVGGFGGKADQLNAYYTATGEPDYFQKDLARYRARRPQPTSRPPSKVPADGPARRAERRAGEKK